MEIEDGICFVELMRIEDWNSLDREADVWGWKITVHCLIQLLIFCPIGFASANQMTRNQQIIS